MTDPKDDKAKKDGKEQKLLVPYSSTLFRSESGQIPTDKALRLKQVTNELKHAINKIVDSTDSDTEDPHGIVFPSAVINRLNDEIKTRLSKEFSTYEVKGITALVVMIHKARLNKQLEYISQTKEAFLEFSLEEYYESIGLKRNKSGKFNKNEKDAALNALMRLHYKHFIVPYETQKAIRIRSVNIVRVHEIEVLKKKADREKGTTIKATVSSLFFDFEMEENTSTEKLSNKHYFNVPADLNARIRKHSTGRLSAGVVILIKYIYHNRHFALSANRTEIEFTLDTLINVMNLHSHVKNRHFNRIHKAIEKGLDIAQSMEIVKGYEREETVQGTEKYILQIDPEGSKKNQLQLDL
jgi:hypothetical protein